MCRAGALGNRGRPWAATSLSALIPQVSDLIQLVKELYTDNQHLKKTIFDLSCMGFQGGDRLESIGQSEVRRDSRVLR